RLSSTLIKCSSTYRPFKNRTCVFESDITVIFIYICKFTPVDKLSNDSANFVFIDFNSAFTRIELWIVLISHRLFKCYLFLHLLLPTTERSTHTCKKNYHSN